MSTELIALLHQLADAVRHPSHQPPSGMAPERLEVYRELVFNNIRNFVRSAFPVLRDIVGDAIWDDKIAQFIAHSELQSPYFIDIPKAFYDFLTQQPAPLPEFALELAYYEWLELDLYRREATRPALHALGRELTAATCPYVFQLSAMTELVVARYPVHQLSRDYQPDTPPDQPTFLALYRDDAGHIKFMRLTALSMAVLQLVAQQALSIEQISEQLASLLPQMALETLTDGVCALLQQCYPLGMLDVHSVQH